MKGTKTEINNKYIMLLKKIMFILCFLIINNQLTMTVIGTNISGMLYYLIIIITSFLVMITHKKIDKNTNYLSKQSFWASVFIIQYVILNQFILDFRFEQFIFGIRLNVFTLQIFVFGCIILISRQIWINMKYHKLIIQAFFLSYLINVILTLNALFIDPMVSKRVGGGMGIGDPFYLGVVGFDRVYALTMLIPLIIYMCYTLKEKKWQALLILFISIYFIFKAGYFIANVLVLLGILVFYIQKANLRIKILLTPIITLVFILFINADLIASILLNLANKIQIFQLQERLIEIANFITSGEQGQTLDRLDLYMNSINSFLSYPLMGEIIANPQVRLSGHSSWLDALGGGGIVHLMPFIMFLFYSYKLSSTNTKSKLGKITVRTCYLTFILLGIVNPVINQASLVFSLLIFLPVVLTFFERREVL